MTRDQFIKLKKLSKSLLIQPSQQWEGPSLQFQTVKFIIWFQIFNKFNQENYFKKKFWTKMKVHA